MNLANNDNKNVPFGISNSVWDENFYSWGFASQPNIPDEYLLKFSDNCYCWNYNIIHYLGIQCGEIIYFSGKEKRSTVRVKDFILSFRIQKNNIQKEWIPYLQLLDILLLLNDMSSKEIKPVLLKYCRLIQNLNYDEKKLLLNLSKKYTPYVRTLLGFVFKTISETYLYNKLRLTVAPKVFCRYEEPLKATFT